MAGAYVLGQLDVYDREALRRYVRAGATSLEPYAVRGLFIDDAPEILEGEWWGPRTIGLRFDSREEALAWYRSDAYQAAIGLRRRAARTNLVLVSGR